MTLSIRKKYPTANISVFAEEFGGWLLPTENLKLEDRV